VKERTGCICEAMEGAAVVHAAMRVGAPAIELRTISNTTGNREQQEWNISLALENLGATVRNAIPSLCG
jgi:futalosine hydrolase